MAAVAVCRARVGLEGLGLARGLIRTAWGKGYWIAAADAPALRAALGVAA